MSAAPPGVRKCAARRGYGPSRGRCATPAGRRRCGVGEEGWWERFCFLLLFSPAGSASSAALYALSAVMCSPRGLPPSRLPLPCSPAARPLRASALSAQEGGVRPSRRRRRCRQQATESAPGATLTWLSHRPSAPRYTSGANRAARPATRSRGSLRAGYPRPSTRSAPPPVRPRTPRTAPASTWAVASFRARARPPAPPARHLFSCRSLWAASEGVGHCCIRRKAHVKKKVSNRK